MTSPPRLRSAMLSGEANAQSAGLPYRIELWQTDRGRVERVLAHVVSASLAQTIFRAALTEYPNRYVTLRRGAQVLASSE